MNDGLAR